MLSLEYLKSKLVNYPEVAILIYKKKKRTTNQRKTYLLIITNKGWEYFQIPTKPLNSHIYLSSNLLFSDFSFSDFCEYDFCSEYVLKFLESRCFLEEVVLTSNEEMSFILKRIIIKDLTSKAIKDIKVCCRTQETSLDFCIL